MRRCGMFGVGCVQCRCATCCCGGPAADASFCLLAGCLSVLLWLSRHFRLYRIVLHRIVLCCIILYHIVLYSSILHRVASHRIVLLPSVFNLFWPTDHHHITSYYIILKSIVLHRMVSYCNVYDRIILY